METSFQIWGEKRKSTLFGKSYVLNSFALSSLIYVGSILLISDHKHIEKLKLAYFRTQGPTCKICM